MDTARNALLALFEEQQVFPHLLSRHYPHVLAGILDSWESPAASALCFDELMLAEPRRKQGFPAAAMSEIFALATLHDLIYPRPAGSPFDIWSRSQELARARTTQPTDDAA
jgi:hypothetical protein